MQIKYSSSILTLFIVSIIMVEGRTISDSSSAAPAPAEAADANAGAGAGAGAGDEVYMIYTEKPPAPAPAESAGLSILATVLGSEKAAKEALVYVYKNAATAFAAKLTPEQAAEVERQPGVLRVVRSENHELLSEPGATGTNMRSTGRMH